MENVKDTTKTSKSFTDFLIILVRRRKLIFWNLFIVSLLALIISFLIPKWYSSTANILPPKSGGLLGDIGSISSTIKDLSKSLGRLGSVSDEAYNYLAILQSRTSMEKTINKFNLRKVYDFDEDDYIEDIINELENNVDFNVEDEGNITIKVTDESPERAAEMSNYFVEVLNQISINLGTLEAKNNREFIEKRYIQSLDDIKRVEDSLQVFSKKYAVYSIADQTKEAISVAAELQAKIEMKKIELQLIQKSYGNDSPLVLDSKLVINEMRKKLEKMGVSDSDSDSNIKLFTPFSQLPEVGVKYLRLKAEYELQSKILEFVVPMYEQAKIEEKKDVPVCVVLDKAVPAEKKAGPKKAIIVLAAFLVSFMFSIVVVLILEALENLHNNEIEYKKINEGIFIPLKRMLFIKR